MIHSENFLSEKSLLAGGPKGLVSATKRMLLHLGFSDVRIIDGANDQGADLLAVRGKKLWVIQSKFTKNKYIDESGVNDCDRALRFYNADKSLLVTNASLSPKAKNRLANLSKLDDRLSALEGKELQKIWEQKLSDRTGSNMTPRDYQLEAKERLVASLDSSNRALLVMATGLGKSAVAGMVVEDAVNKGVRNILVLAHLKELVEQLEESFWPFLSKNSNTRHVHGDSSKEGQYSGVVVATPDAALKLDDFHPDLIIVDEAHHVSESGMLSKILSFWSAIPQLGLTATPWRGDKYDIQNAFGSATYKIGLAQGMARGWLSEVDYKVYSDNIDWERIRNLSKNSYSIAELNKLLFIPHRDQQIIDELLEVWNKKSQPQAILFCSSIEHAERMLDLVRRSNPSWKKAATIHSRMPKRERQLTMSAFKSGRCPIITCVDVFNEGVDVPNVSIIAFLKVTHSRRIFVQQIGRGLRLSDNRDQLSVLDFVTDIRRLREISDLKSEYLGELEELSISRESEIRFESASSESLANAWLRDVADLNTAADDTQLNFPDPEQLI